MKIKQKIYGRKKPTNKQASSMSDYNFEKVTELIHYSLVAIN
jgi:hypothetical protein